jgi:hypothetical protein
VSPNTLSADKESDPSADVSIRPQLLSANLSPDNNKGATLKEKYISLSIGLEVQLCRPQMKIDADNSHSTSQNAATLLPTTSIGPLILAQTVTATAYMTERLITGFGQEKINGVHSADSGRNTASEPSIRFPKTRDYE